MARVTDLERAELTQLLVSAQQEVVTLRRQNEILNAKVQMIDLFACVLHTTPARGSGVGMGEDVVWAINKLLTKWETEKSQETKQG